MSLNENDAANDEVEERRKKRKDLVGDRMKERCTGSLDST